MKALFILIILFHLIVFKSFSQTKPLFIGTKSVNNGGMGPDQVDTWNYKGFVFKTITPGIARPIVYTEIYIKGKNGLKKINNTDLFGNNISTVSEMVNSKLSYVYSSQQAEEPNCYPGYRQGDLNQLSISVDDNFMYFEITWDTSYLTDASSDCLNPSTIAKISLKDPGAWGALEQFIGTK